MFTYMTGAGEQGEGGWGDADFVRLVPPQQYLSHYVFFADPTYPFTTLTVVRTKKDGAVRGRQRSSAWATITGWQPVGRRRLRDRVREARRSLQRHERLQQRRATRWTRRAPFGVWVWGWGSEDTKTGWVSYGYPAGEGVLPINDVVIL